MLRAENTPHLAQLYRDADCVFFDCDGVIFDSNGFKVDAMLHALDDQNPRACEAMLAYWRENGGVSRWVKFRHFFEVIAPHPDAEGRVMEACARFGDYSRAAYSAHSPTPEAIALALHKGASHCYVVSGAAQRELESVFDEKSLSDCFAAVLGSPEPKLSLVRGVLERRGVSPRRSLLIGDGAGDFRLCRQLDMPFVYLHAFSEWTEAAKTLEGEERVVWADDWPTLLRALDVPS